MAAGGVLEELPDGDSDGLGGGEVITLPGAPPLRADSPVGPGDDDAADGDGPMVGASVTRTTRGVGVPCAPAAEPEDGDGPGDDDADGAGPAGTSVMVTVGIGGAAAPTSGTNSITTASSAIPTAPTADR
jgi:hypothetical protein